MSADRDAVDRLIESVADGVPVDWDLAPEAGALPPRSRVKALETIARIASFSRSVQRAAAQAEFPERWGTLLLLERLGAGSQADVFRAWDPTLRREIALKLMRAGSGAGDDALVGEGRAAAAIRHPHVVTVLGVERHDGRVGLSMELLRGATLESEVLANGALDPAACARLAAAIGAGLAAVHAAGFVHRDLKPSNVVHDAEGRYVLADFGLGLQADVARNAGARGTPMYMAPEVLEGGAATPRSDVYALGLLLWFALTGRHPFAVATVADRIAAARRGPEPALRTVLPDVPAKLAAAIERALAADPFSRPASAREFVAEIEAAAVGSAKPPRSVRPVAWVLAVVIAILAAVLGLRRPAERVAVAPAPAATASAAYDVSATFQRWTDGAALPLAPGERVRPGDRLTLELRASRPLWVYVLNEDEQGEQFLLFPQPLFDRSNPLTADSTFVLPGTIAGEPSGWTVTSAGGREHFLVVASPEPVAELEADLARLPAVRVDAPVQYARVGTPSRRRLRGVGGVNPLTPVPATASGRRSSFENYRSLASTERGITGIWVRQLTLENPRGSQPRE